MEDLTLMNALHCLKAVLQREVVFRITFYRLCNILPSYVHVCKLLSLLLLEHAGLRAAKLSAASLIASNLAH